MRLIFNVSTDNTQATKIYNLLYKFHIITTASLDQFNRSFTPNTNVINDVT